MTYNYIIKKLRRDWDLYLFVLPVIAYYIIFHYAPMYGAQIAFKNYIPSRGILGSSWVGLAHFKQFFNSFYFMDLISNTLLINLYALAVGFPIPILLALSINEIRNASFKKTIQTVTYAPHFISEVVLVGIVVTFLSPRYGIINEFIKVFGVSPIDFMKEPAWFKTVYVLSGIWQNAGWNSVIYIAVLSNVSEELIEAAKVDGASRLQRIRHVSLPVIMPTAIILFIMNCGRMMNVGFEKIFLMQNDLNITASDVISTYVYRAGLIGAQFSYASAIGLFNSVINVTILLVVNKISVKVNEQGLW